MKLISDETVNEHKSKYNQGFGLCAIHETFFDLGVQFSENELQNLAIEFAKWNKSFGSLFESVENNFKTFIEQRNQ